MKSALHGLSRVALLDLARGVSAGWLTPPYTALPISNLIPAEESQAVAWEFERLRAAGFASNHIAETLRLMATEHAHAQAVEDRVELVWTGPDVPGCVGRDTWVVVRDLFLKAQKSLLISAFAIRNGHEVFKPIVAAQKLRADRAVTIFVNISRGNDSSSSDAAVVSTFANNFWIEHWPWRPRPCVYYDPRGVTRDYRERASLHAKCLIADDEVTFLSSANFTEWAQERNIEAGTLIADPIFSRALRAQFESLVAADKLFLLPGSPVEIDT